MLSSEYFTLSCDASLSCGWRVVWWVEIDQTDEKKKPHPFLFVLCVHSYLNNVEIFLCNIFTHFWGEVGININQCMIIMRKFLQIFFLIQNTLTVIDHLF